MKARNTPVNLLHVGHEYRSGAQNEPPITSVIFNVFVLRMVQGGEGGTLTLRPFKCMVEDLTGLNNFFQFHNFEPLYFFHDCRKPGSCKGKDDF